MCIIINILITLSFLSYLTSSNFGYKPRAFNFNQINKSQQHVAKELCIFENRFNSSEYSIQFLQYKRDIQIQMDCLGCHTSFKQGEKLKILEGLYVEFKNYSLPIKEQESIKTLLKTIISFLNSKGGTIYIGVEDNKGEVKGVQMFENDKKQFQVFINRLLEHINPKITQDDQSLIKLQFVPVLPKNGFENKYVIKIVINQGNPSLYYCYTQRILLEAQDQQVQHQIPYGYFRHNMGGVELCKGLNLLKQIRNKALNPSAVSQPFHPNCNPSPLVTQSEFCGLYIKCLMPKQAKQIQQFFEEQFIQQKIEFSSTFKEERHTLLIKFQKQTQFQTLKRSLLQIIVILNIKFPNYQFSIVDQYEKHLILNKKNKNEFYRQQSNKKEQNNKKSTNKQEQSNNKPKQQKKQQFKPFVHEEKMQKISRPNNQSLQNFPKKHSVTLTHLALDQVDNLIEAINYGFESKQKRIVKYTNSVQVFLRNPELQCQFYEFILNNNKEFKQFGYNQKNILFGFNSGRIIINNFNLTKKMKIVEALIQKINQPFQMQQIVENVKKNEKKISLCLYFRNKGRACFWLDQLLKDRMFREKFGIPGSELGQKPKMKFILDLERAEIA